MIEMRAFSASKPLRSGAHHGLGLSRRSAYENQIGAAIVDDTIRHAMRAYVLPFCFGEKAASSSVSRMNRLRLSLVVYVAFDYAFAVSSHGFAIVSR